MTGDDRLLGSCQRVPNLVCTQCEETDDGANEEMCRLGQDWLAGREQREALELADSPGISWVEVGADEPGVGSPEARGRAPPCEARSLNPRR